MIKCNYKYLAFIFSIFYINSNEYSKFLFKTSPKPITFKYTEYKNSRKNKNEWLYFLGNTELTFIYRSQSIRNTTCFKGQSAYANKYSTYGQFLNKNHPYTCAGYARLYKLILFPFHVFW